MQTRCFNDLQHAVGLKKTQCAIKKLQLPRFSWYYTETRGSEGPVS